ncbi:hypothetical protein B566_EDAN003774 [Ephemera danica]|nr:hypothetical protein B566_EDAN003774 [Ephemera danica]
MVLNNSTEEDLSRLLLAKRRVKEACNKLPIRDAYVLESMSSLLPQQTFLQSFLLKREMQAMLIALLNSRLPQQHRVYFLRSRIISRLYKIQVGSERVSSQPLVEQLLNGQGIGPDNTSKLKSVEPELEAVYRSQTGNQKEAKANALLLGIAFLKLAVHGDLVCHQALKVSMNPQMLIENGSLTKITSTVSTAVWFFICMDSKMTLLSKSFPAFWARIRSGFYVDTTVLKQC